LPEAFLRFVCYLYVMALSTVSKKTEKA